LRVILEKELRSITLILGIYTSTYLVRVVLEAWAFPEFFDDDYSCKLTVLFWNSTPFLIVDFLPICLLLRLHHFNFKQQEKENESESESEIDQYESEGKPSISSSDSGGDGGGYGTETSSSQSNRISLDM